MNKNYLFLILGVLVFLPFAAQASHTVSEAQFDSLGAYSRFAAGICDFLLSDNRTFSDEPYRFLYSVYAGGNVERDDTWAAHLTVNGQMSQLYTYGNCRCSTDPESGCPGTDNVWWLPVFQDSGTSQADSVTITGNVYNKAGNIVGFQGYQTMANWKLCDAKQVTNNGACRDITGNIESDKTTCTEPCSPRISWLSEFAEKVVVKKNGSVFESGSQNSGIIDSNLSAGTYTYVLYGTASNGSNASQEFELDRVVVVVSKEPTTPPPTPTPTPTPTTTSDTQVDLKVNDSDWPLTVNGGTTLTISWGAKGGVSPTYFNCTASGSWSGSKSTSGYQLSSTSAGVAETRNYAISCFLPSGAVTSDSVSVTITAERAISSDSCSLSVNPSSVNVGGQASWTVNSNPSGYHFDWHGTDNGNNIGTVSGGNTNNFSTYTYNQPAEYTRYVTVNLPGNVCRAPASGTVNLSVTSGGGGGPGGGGTEVGSAFLTATTDGGYVCDEPAVNEEGEIYCLNGERLMGNWIDPLTNVPVNRKIVDFMFNFGRSFNLIGDRVDFDCTNDGVVDGSVARTGRNWNWPQIPIFDVCEYPSFGTTYTARAKVYSGNILSTNCLSGNQAVACDDTATIVTVSPPAPPPQTLSVNLYADPSFGYDPLSTTLTANLGGTASGNIDYSFWWNCNDSTTSVDVAQTACGNLPSPAQGQCAQNPVGFKCNGVSATQKSVTNIYGPSRNPYFAKVIVGRGTAPFAEMRQQITVLDLSLKEIFWDIRSDTYRYRADYNYNNDSFLDKTDLTTLQNLAIQHSSCPSGKICDINNNGVFNIGDVLAYANYLKTLKIDSNAASQTAIAYLFSQSGNSVDMSVTGAPSGYRFSPRSFSLPPGGAEQETVFSVPSGVPVGIYTITAKATGGITKSFNPLTLEVVSPPPPLQPDFGLNKDKDVFVNIVGTQAVTSNSAKITVSVFDGFSSAVNLSVQSVSPALSGAVFNFSDTSLSLGEFGTGSDFSVTVPANTTPGVYTIKIRGIDGGLVRNVDVRLNVNTKDPSFKEI